MRLGGQHRPGPARPAPEPQWPGGSLTVIGLGASRRIAARASVVLAPADTDPAMPSRITPPPRTTVPSAAMTAWLAPSPPGFGRLAAPLRAVPTLPPRLGPGADCGPAAKPASPPRTTVASHSPHPTPPHPIPPPTPPPAHGAPRPPGRDRHGRHVPCRDRTGCLILGRGLRGRLVLAAWLGSFAPSLPPGSEAPPRRATSTGLHDHSWDRLGRLLPCLPRLPRPPPRIARRRFSDHRPNAAPKGRQVLLHGGRPGRASPDPFRARWARCSHTVSGRFCIQMVGMFLDPRVCGLHSGHVPVQTPVLSCGGPFSGRSGPTTRVAPVAQE